MPRITTDTPDPAWFRALDRDIGLKVHRLSRLPIIIDAECNSLGLTATSNFIKQIGCAVIEAFPVWLDNMLLRADDPDVQLFLRANRLEEREHWRWWRSMARHWHLTDDDFGSAVVAPAVLSLSRYLRAASKHAPIACAMTAVNLIVETDAACLTGEIAPAMRLILNEEECRWIEAHAAGDTDHAADARELIKKMVGNNITLQRRVQATARKTAALFTEALRAAYE
jgi:pyrroloquinoline quinone (PQQ) biosynthesis protein C